MGGRALLATMSFPSSRVSFAISSPRSPFATRGWVQLRMTSEFLGESDEKTLRPPDVTEPIRVFILDDFANELRTALAKPLERVVDLVHSEHEA